MAANVPKSRRTAWGNEERALLALATEVLRRHYRPHRHTVACALVAGSGKVYTGVCMDGLHSPCAETIAFGCAKMAGETTILRIVAVNREGVIPPCGNCRQMLIDYAPRAEVLVKGGRPGVKLSAEELLPYAFRTFG